MKIISMLIILAFSSIANAQLQHFKVDQYKEVQVKSWKTGSETVSNQKLSIVVSSEKPEYSAIIAGNSGKKYELSLNYKKKIKPAGIWKVELRESISKNSKKKVNQNLLSSIEIEPGMDYFPEGLFIGYLYPGEAKPSITENGDLVLGALPVCDNISCYPIKTIRKISIENFCVVIKVEDYKINAKNKAKLDSMNVVIEFKNDCK